MGHGNTVGMLQGRIQRRKSLIDMANWHEEGPERRAQEEEEVEDEQRGRKRRGARVMQREYPPTTTHPLRC